MLFVLHLKAISKNNAFYARPIVNLFFFLISLLLASKTNKKISAYRIAIGVKVVLIEISGQLRLFVSCHNLDL